MEIKGEGTIEADGGDFLFSCGNNGKLEIDGVDIVYNCQEKAANRAAINTGTNPVTIKNNTITTNCTAVRQNNSGKLIMENTTINVNLRSEVFELKLLLRSLLMQSCTDVYSIPRQIP